jgi:hypothetical protein
MFRGTLRALTEPTTSRPTSLSGICIEHSDLDLMALDHTRQVQPGPAQQHDEKSVATSKGVAVLYCLMIAQLKPCSNHMSGRPTTTIARRSPVYSSPLALTSKESRPGSPKPLRVRNRYRCERRSSSDAVDSARPWLIPRPSGARIKRHEAEPVPLDHVKRVKLRHAQHHVEIAVGIVEERSCCTAWRTHTSPHLGTLHDQQRKIKRAS